MQYLTFAPHENIDRIVECFWLLEGTKEELADIQTIVPDGYMEMIFHYGDKYMQYTACGSTILQPRSFVIGQLSRPLKIQPTGNTGIFSVRFKPDGFRHLSKVPLKELEDTAVGLDQVFGQQGNVLRHDILHAKSTEERIAIAEKFLTVRMSDSHVIRDLLKSTYDIILETQGQISVGKISALQQVNRRNIERKFATEIGLSPKKFSKIIRMQHTLSRLLNKDSQGLTALAYEGGYYDQAHFIKDFKDLTGVTPGEFYGDQLIMSSLFYKK